MCCGPSTCGCVPTWARRRLASACDACVDACADTVDRAARCVEPFMCMGAAMLVLADAWLFFSGPVLRGAGRGGGPAGAAAVALHGAFAAWLLGNVLLNHALCTFSTPGTTKEEDMQELSAAWAPGWRWCDACARHKPPMAHHCSVCRKCVLKMDHHCVWMANCIGFNNYRFFFLYVWWMWVGCAYSASMTFFDGRRRYRVPKQWIDADFFGFFLMILAASAWLGLSILLAWHVYLIVSGSGTIDTMMSSSRGADKNSASAPARHSNPYDLGPAANWREAFDVSGPLWWLTWMLPTVRRKKGSGLRLPTSHKDGHDAAGAGASLV
mmetsp:Transcript_30943/g.92078  ORF Transcript_30943/g.92078 Transcript_30943/m.92078 type:complete len:325 (-) Transcript_30943:89-1063(-)